MCWSCGERPPRALPQGSWRGAVGHLAEVPIRFASFEKCKGSLADKQAGKMTVRNTFIGARFIPRLLPRLRADKGERQFNMSTHVNCMLYDVCRIHCAPQAPFVYPSNAPTFSADPSSYHDGQWPKMIQAGKFGSRSEAT